MIDYILFTRQHFRSLGSLDQIQESWFKEKKIVGCPHVHLPSDHFSLLVELELKPTPHLAPYMARINQVRSLTEANMDLMAYPNLSNNYMNGRNTPTKVTNELVGSSNTTTHLGAGPTDHHSTGKHRKR